MTRVLILGAGLLGGNVLQQLVIKNPDVMFWLAARDKLQVQLQVNLARYIGIQWNGVAKVHPLSSDVLDKNRFARQLKDIKPDIVFNATTPFAWWKINELPTQYAEMCNRVGPGIWAAIDALLPTSISEAIRLSGTNPLYINGCYPDNINSFLSEHKSGPKVGIGNIANVVPGLKLVFSEVEKVETHTVDLRIFGHHYTSLNAPVVSQENSCPYLLWVRVGSETRVYKNDDWPFKYFREKFPRPRGREGQGVTISSASRLLDGLIKREHFDFHAPGVDGLVGGYAIRVNSNREITPNIPTEFSKQDVVNINLSGMRLDGIESVSANRMILSQDAQSAFREVLGFDCPPLQAKNLFEISSEIIKRLNHKFGLSLKSI